MIQTPLAVLPAEILPANYCSLVLMPLVQEASHRHSVGLGWKLPWNYYRIPRREESR